MQKIVVRFLSFVLVEFPMLFGYGFAAVMMIAGSIAVITYFGHVRLIAFSILSYGWKIYLLFFLSTLLTMNTLLYEDCCMDTDAFFAHLLHAGWGTHVFALIVALFWPIGWNRMNKDIPSEGIVWIDIIKDVFQCWSAAIRRQCMQGGT